MTVIKVLIVLVLNKGKSVFRGVYLYVLVTIRHRVCAEEEEGSPPP